MICVYILDCEETNTSQLTEYKGLKLRQGHWFHIIISLTIQVNQDILQTEIEAEHQY